MQTPDADHNPYSYSPYGGNQPATMIQPGTYVSPGLVGHVLVLSILQIALGILELLFAIFFGVYSFVFPSLISKQQFNQDQIAGLSIMSTVFAVVATLLALVGILRLTSGISGLWLRYRVLTIVSLILGFAACLTFYCAPFALGIGIYGLIVMFNREVAEAYRLVASGYSASQVKDYFQRGTPLQKNSSEHPFIQ